MEKNLYRSVRFLTAYAIISSLGFAFALLSFTNDRRLYADEITAKKST